MKNKIQFLISYITIMLVVCPLMAQTPDDKRPPIVPMDVLSQGHQFVTSYLLKKVGYIKYSWVGKSVFNHPGQNTKWIDVAELHGYIPGSFSSLSDMLQTRRSTLNLIDNADRQYDVRLEVDYVTHDNETALTGNGYMEITRGKDGKLSASLVEPEVDVNYKTSTIIKGQVLKAEWLGGWGESLPLEYNYNMLDDSTTVTIPAKIIGRGKIGFNIDFQNRNLVIAYDMASGKSSQGQEAMVTLGKTVSGDVVAVNTVNTQSLPTQTNAQSSPTPTPIFDLSKSGYFYRSFSDGKIYGKFPLIDINSPSGGKFYIKVAPEIWGTNGDRIVPNLVGLEKLAEGKGGDKYSISYDIDTGIITFELSPGCYHVRTIFDGVFEIDSDPNQGKG